MRALRVLVVGSSGRMGRTVIDLMKEVDGVKFAGGIDRKTKIDRKTQADVVIDFSSPPSTVQAARWCQSQGIAFVSGTTGLKKSHFQTLKQVAKYIPVLWAPNMSLGISLMVQMMEALVGVEGMDFRIEEIHHKGKKDNPSGTALFLQEKLKEVARKKIEVPVGIRGGGVFGNHKIYIFGDEESLVLEHCAFNRKVFARGALRAVKWIKGREAGLYTMGDLLGSPKLEPSRLGSS